MLLGQGAQEHAPAHRLRVIRPAEPVEHLDPEVVEAVVPVLATRGPLQPLQGLV